MPTWNQPAIPTQRLSSPSDGLGRGPPLFPHPFAPLPHGGCRHLSSEGHFGTGLPLHQRPPERHSKAPEARGSVRGPLTTSSALGTNTARNLVSYSPGKIAGTCAKPNPQNLDPRNAGLDLKRSELSCGHVQKPDVHSNPNHHPTQKEVKDGEINRGGGDDPAVGDHTLDHAVGGHRPRGLTPTLGKGGLDRRGEDLADVHSRPEATAPVLKGKNTNRRLRQRTPLGASTREWVPLDDACRQFAGDLVPRPLEGLLPRELLGEVDSPCVKGLRREDLPRGHANRPDLHPRPTVLKPRLTRDPQGLKHGHRGHGLSNHKDVGAWAVPTRQFPDRHLIPGHGLPGQFLGPGQALRRSTKELDMNQIHDVETVFEEMLDDRRLRCRIGHWPWDLPDDQSLGNDHRHRGTTLAKRPHAQEEDKNCRYPPQLLPPLHCLEHSAAVGRGRRRNLP